tara:strand:- start:456 stop:1838 length:1383 start_codon:yes stop_codon:yes gene_type:complete
MKIEKIEINKTLIFFLFIHLLAWTLIPSISNNNLPLDTIEALAWGSNLDWGYNKHPPLSAFAVEFFYRIFGNNDWAYYLLSQLFIIVTFLIIFNFSKYFFKKKIYSLISLFLLEGIYFYNFTTPEFNVNICQLPFWALTVLYCWRGINDNKVIDWLLFGFFAALGVLSKYLFIYLLVTIDIFFIYLIYKKKFNNKCLISLFTFFVILVPHIVWLTENNYSTVAYAFSRTGITDFNLLNHLTHPFIFLGKQIGILIPFFLMIIFLVKKFKIKFYFKDKKFLYLLTINIIPIILVFLTSMFMGVKIRTMWMTPFYLFFGVLFVYIFQSKINLKKLKEFFIIFSILFILSPSIYLYVSISQTDKRTDYPGKEIAEIVQNNWENNFKNNIGIVGGDEWHGGNLSYHLKSRPKWDNIFESNKNIPIVENDNGFVLIGDMNTLSGICNGVFVKVKKQGVCMIGTKK